MPGATHIGAGDLPEMLDGLPRDRPIATICASGYRSGVAASMLRAAGFEECFGPGGVPGWEAHGYPLEYGRSRRWAVARRAREGRPGEADAH